MNSITETATTTPEHPDVAEFLSVLDQASALRAKYDEATGAVVAILEQLQSLDREARRIRAKLSQSGEEARVDGRGWPAMSEAGLLVHQWTRVVPMGIEGPRWPAL